VDVATRLPASRGGSAYQTVPGNERATTMRWAGVRTSARTAERLVGATVERVPAAQ